VTIDHRAPGAHVTGTHPSVGIITSAAYVDTELMAEFGRIPPSFLPLGHERIFTRQVVALQALVDQVVLTLPESFDVPPSDAAWLEEHGVTVLSLPDGLSLAQSIHHALVLSGARGSVRLLHGDTLFLAPLPSELDVISVGPAPDFYRWAEMRSTGQRPSFQVGDGGGQEVLSGFFAFSSAVDLLIATLQRRGDFLGALGSYSETSRLVPVTVPGWLDFGHLQTYYAAKSAASIARSFNSLDFSRHSVRKRSSNLAKIDAEARWFETIPPPLRLFTPPFLGRDGDGYRLAYEASPTLHELFVFGNLSLRTWAKVVDVCHDFLEECARLAEGSSEVPGLDELVIAKTEARLAEWSASGGLPLDQPVHYAGSALPSLTGIVQRCSALISAGTPIPGVLHGDFCFPNVFFDYQAELIRVVDPRGTSGGDTTSLLGDLRYDLAKFNHSLEGYDYILSGRYRLTGVGEQSLRVEFPDASVARGIRGVMSRDSIAGVPVDRDEITALTVLLFLSMLPLHADRPDRQQAFLANGLRLYTELEASR
jgi:hypothetical protein